MDTTLARTFLAIVESGSFLHAADRLHVTQTAVSARVKTLEAQLGRTLFVRNKSGATLTSAGPSSSCATPRRCCRCGSARDARLRCRPAGVRC